MTRGNSYSSVPYAISSQDAAIMAPPRITQAMVTQCPRYCSSQAPTTLNRPMPTTKAPAIPSKIHGLFESGFIVITANNNPNMGRTRRKIPMQTNRM